MAFSALWLGAALFGKGTREVSVMRNIWNLASAFNFGENQKKTLPRPKK